MSDPISKTCFQPHVVPLPKEWDSLYAFRRLRGLPHCCWLDSALAGPPRGRFSFLCSDPIDVLEVHIPTADPLVRLEGWLGRYRTETQPALPPFQGGVAGYFGYEFGRCFEKIPKARHDEFSLPIAVLGLYDVVLAWDHHLGKGWLISQGFCEDGAANWEEGRTERAMARAQFFLERLDSSMSVSESIGHSAERSSVHAMAHGLTAPQFETRLGGGWLGNFDSQGYRSAVQRVRLHLRWRYLSSELVAAFAMSRPLFLFRALRETPSRQRGAFRGLFRFWSRTNYQRITRTVYSSGERLDRNAPDQRNETSDRRSSHRCARGKRAACFAEGPIREYHDCRPASKRFIQDLSKGFDASRSALCHRGIPFCASHGELDSRSNETGIDVVGFVFRDLPWWEHYRRSKSSSYGDYRGVRADCARSLLRFDGVLQRGWCDGLEYSHSHTHGIARLVAIPSRRRDRRR